MYFMQVPTREEEVEMGDGETKIPFRNRLLTDEKNVFEHNAWYLHFKIIK